MGERVSRLLHPHFCSSAKLKAHVTRDESAASAVVPSAATVHAADADALIKAPQQRAMQTIECSKLARLIISAADSRPLDQHAADVMLLLKEDEKCSQPQLTLSHELDVADTATHESLYAADSAGSNWPPLCACDYQSGRLLLFEFLHFLCRYHRFH
jgi:hypothetical protein